MVATSVNGLFVGSFIGKGDGTFSANVGSQVAAGDWSGYSAFVADVNGDGKSDVVLVNATVGGLYVDILIGNGDGTFRLVGGNASNGSGLINNSNWGGGLYNPATGTGTYSAILGDANGDGKADLTLVALTTNGAYAFTLAASPNIPDLLSQITTGLGATTSITYQPLSSSVYTKDSTAVFPVQDVRSPMDVVSRVDRSNGIGGTYSATYTYAGAKADQSGRGFLGFRQMAVTDLQTGIVHTTSYRQDFPFVGFVASETKVLGTPTLNQATNTYQFSNASGAASVSTPSNTGAPYRVSVSQSVASSFDLDGSVIPPVTTTYQYDAFGNATQVTTSTPDGFSKTTTSTYTNDTTLWYLGRLTTATVTSTTP
jgi:hypothetical protein